MIPVRISFNIKLSNVKLETLPTELPGTLEQVKTKHYCLLDLRH